MKNHELLDLIGEANEDYVLEAGNNVVKPRFGWKKLAACAACAALVLAAYPVYRMSQGQSGSGLLPLHDYTVVEGGGALATENEMKIPAGSAGADVSMPGGAYVGGDTGNGIDGTEYSAPGQEAPVQEYAADQYDKLLRGMGMHGEGASSYPDWFAGAWIDNGYQPEARLTVAIVDGFRTDELEAEITGWCGDGVVFQSAKYSHDFLDSLMEPVTALLDGTGLTCGIGVDVVENCLGVDLYSDGADMPKEVLAELAKLDPDGDAIRVRLFTQAMNTLTDEIKKGPAPGGTTETVFDGARVKPNEEAGPVSDAKNFVEELPETKEAGQPAHYDILPLDE